VTDQVPSSTVTAVALTDCPSLEVPDTKTVNPEARVTGHEVSEQLIPETVPDTETVVGVEVSVVVAVTVGLDDVSEAVIVAFPLVLDAVTVAV
jgi:hypothetical protein